MQAPYHVVCGTCNAAQFRYAGLGNGEKTAFGNRVSLLHHRSQWLIDTLQYQHTDEYTHHGCAEKPDQQGFRLIPKRLIGKLRVANHLDNAEMQQRVRYLRLASFRADRKEINEPLGNTGFYLILHPFRDHLAIRGGDRYRFILSSIKKCCVLKSDSDWVFT